MSRDEQTAFLLSSSLALVIGVAFGYALATFEVARRAAVATYQEQPSPWPVHTTLTVPEKP